MAIRVPSSRATLNPNPWATWYRPNPPLCPGVVDAPVLLAVSVEAGRITVWESVLTLVVTGMTGGPEVVATMGRVVVGMTTGEVTTGEVVEAGITLMVTGVSPAPLHTL